MLKESFPAVVEPLEMTIILLHTYDIRWRRQLLDGVRQIMMTATTEEALLLANFSRQGHLIVLARPFFLDHCI